MFKKPSLEFMQISSKIKWAKERFSVGIKLENAKKNMFDSAIASLERDNFIPVGYKEDKGLEAMVRDKNAAKPQKTKPKAMVAPIKRKAKVKKCARKPKK